jgi:hypothetical protein
VVGTCSLDQVRLKICGICAGRRHALLCQRKAGTRAARMFRIDNPVCLLDYSLAKRLQFLFHVLRPSKALSKLPVFRDSQIHPVIHDHCSSEDHLCEKFSSAPHLLETSLSDGD